MICNCGGITETVHKVVRDKVLQGEYQKCGCCGRILWMWKTSVLDNELTNASEQHNAKLTGESNA